MNDIQKRAANKTNQTLLTATSKLCPLYESIELPQIPRK